MPDYRIYEINPDDRISNFPREIVAESDDGAISVAQAQQGELDLEIWQGTRMIFRLRSISLSPRLCR